MSATGCDHPLDAIHANPFNRAVQCHRCGETFERLDDVEDWELGPDAARSDPRGAA